MKKGLADLRDWDEEDYREFIFSERELQCGTLFRAAFAPYAATDNPKADVLAVAASNGSVSGYSISSCVSSFKKVLNANTLCPLSASCISRAEPLYSIQAHEGPAYDVKFYGEGEDALLLSCGDDGRILGWRWKDVMNSTVPIPSNGHELKPVLDLVNPQHKGPWGALSPIPENNAIDVNTQDGTIFSAAGDACAYCWDVETSKRKLSFRGHSGYLHSVVACRLSSQIITGSEDGTTRLWDSRSGRCTKVIRPGNGQPNASSWISSVAVDASESWLACGSSKGLSVWTLPSCECIWSFDTHAPVQDLLFDNNQVLTVGAEPMLTRYNINGLPVSQIHCSPQSAFSISRHPSGLIAVGGYGGLVDVISEFGSHMCMFRCQGL